LQWYDEATKGGTSSSSTLSDAELQQLALSSTAYYPLTGAVSGAHYPSSYPPAAAAADPTLASSLVPGYGAISHRADSLSPVDTKLESQAASATYTTPLGTKNLGNGVA